jgi:hydroxymethylpyrimidine pyrophosphatase-like HAD family hydrolase
MNSAVQAIAVDYDGTLTDNDRPSADVLAALRAVRQRGRVVVLVTGRILSELRAAFPGVDGEFDAIVAENGAVLADADGIRDLAAPVDAALAQALAHRDIPVRQGRVLLACDTEHASAVGEEIARLGLDCQQIRNRAALMVLPGGVTKGTGLIQALGNLGISRHSTLAIGDAENDHHLLTVCELGVAVGNAVDALKKHADLVLEQADGTGVAAFLHGPIVGGDRALPPSHWQLTLGVDDVGNELQVPASQINLLLVGASGSGKSYLAGLLVEQLVRFDYSVLVLDREGDHRTLAERRGILGVGGKDPLPNAHQLAALIRHRFGSVVVDLSQLSQQDQHDYVVAITPAILAQRAVTGLPHWIFFDEAHTLPVGGGRWEDALSAGDKGFCLSTYMPGRLPESMQASTDLMVLCAGTGTQGDQVHRYVSDTGCASAEELAWLLDGERGRALLIDAAGSVPPKPFTVQRRSSGHVRHWHKYIDGQLPERLRFYFTGSDRVSGNLREFHRHLAACGGSSLEAHARHHDFSRWIHDVLQDTDLAESVATIERQLRTGEISTDGLRDAIQVAIETRYLE